MSHPKSLLAAIGVSAFVFVAEPAQADNAIDQIIVSGARAPIAVGDLGSAVTVITRADIERRQVRYVTDLLRSVPGFAVSHTGVVGSQTQVRVRGSEANHVLVLIDGVRANDPATGDEFRWEYLSTANIERIEIVRGPQSALWGSDALGGVVHIVTRSGNGSMGGNGYLEAGTENTLNGALNGSFGGDGWSLGLGIEQLKTDGFNISRTGDENDDSDITAASLNAKFNPSDALTFTLGARSINAWSQFDGVDFFVTGLPQDSDIATDTRQTFAQAGVAIGAADATLRHNLAVHYFNSDNINIRDGVEDSSAASERTRVGYQADVAVGDNRLSLAFEHEKTQFEQRGPVVFDDPNQDQETDVTSAVVDFQGHATDSVTYLLSARLDQHSDFDDIVTGRASITWDVADSTTLRANIGTGHKTPTFIERFGYFPGSFAGNPDLKPEYSTSYDLGVDRSFGAGSVQFSLFQQDLEDEINGYFCGAPWPAPCTAINMDGTSKRRGAELATHLNVTDNLSIAATYTYTHSEDADSATELRRPRHAGSLNLDYAFLDSRANINLVADYGGTRKDIFFPPWPNPSEIVTLQNFWLVDLTGRYAVSDSVTLFARASNLLDTEYEQVFGYRTPGRAFHGGVQVDFGN